MLSLKLKHIHRICGRCTVISRGLTESNADSESRPITKPPSAVDHFLGINSDEGVVDTGLTKYNNQLPLKKYSGMAPKPPNSVDHIFTTTFGDIRYDKDNQLRKRAKHRTINIKEQYFGSSIVKNEKDKYMDEPNNFIEEQYFSTSIGDESKALNEIQRPDFINEEDEYKDGGNFIEDSYFSRRHNSMTTNEPDFTSKIVNDRPSLVFEDDDRLNARRFNPAESTIKNARPATSAEKLDKSESRVTREFNDFVDSFGDLSNDNKSRVKVSKSPENKVSINETNLEKMWRLEKEAADSKTTKTAFDYVLRRRKAAKLSESQPKSDNSQDQEPNSRHKPTGPSAEKADSKGFRILNQVHDLDNMTEFMLLQLLKNSILYNENEIVAISKPYGLPVHPGFGHRHCLTNFIPDLIKHVSSREPATDLYTVHRLDKETTGVLLLAKTQKMADILHSLFAEGKILKTYWALVKNVPTPSAGIIDIPMYEAISEGKSRMMLKIEYNNETKSFIKKSSRKCHQAITAYSVLSSTGNCALVELKPQTGVKHQLRVHLASGLGCPILGDHKYSHFLKLAPQKLPSDLLQRLNIRQSKVRHVPMHLHARVLTIPEIMEGRNIVIGARLPKHFSANLKRLEISWPKDGESVI